MKTQQTEKTMTGNSTTSRIVRRTVKGTKKQAAAASPCTVVYLG